MNRIVPALASACCLLLVSASRAAFDCRLVEGDERPDHRINLVFYASGYTEAEKGRWEADVKSAIGTIFEHTPFREYRPYFSLYAAWTPSRRSGLPTVESDSVAFRIANIGGYPNLPAIGFWEFESDTSFACDGRGQDFVFQNPGIVLVNATTISAITYSQRWTAVGMDQMHRAGVHELGHIIGGLADEYSSGNPTVWIDDGTPEGIPNAQAWNVWNRLDRKSAPWSVWIEDSVPIPTPPTEPYLDAIGMFEGADHLPTRRWRPSYACKMRGPDVPFCKVCQEKLASAILSWRTPVLLDSVFPAPSNRWMGTTSVISGGVVAVRPVRSDSFGVRVRWRFQGNGLAGVRETLQISSLVGDGQLEAILEAPSPFIRNPNLVPRDTLRWTVRKPTGAMGRRENPDGIRQIGPGLFLVSGGSELPVARDLRGGRLDVVEVGVVSGGRIVRVVGGARQVLLTSPSEIGSNLLLH